MKHLYAIALLGAALFLAQGCVIDTVPLPEFEPTALFGNEDKDDPGSRAVGGDPSDQNDDGFMGGGPAGAPPGVDLDASAEGIAAYVDTGAMYWSDQGAFTLLVGVTGSLPGGGSIVIVNPSRNDEYRTVIRADGSFAGPINAQLFDELEINYEWNGAIWDTAYLTLLPGSVNAYDANSELADGLNDSSAANPITVERSDAEHVTLTGTTDAGIAVIVANLNQNTAVRAFAGDDGQFSAHIDAATGDYLEVFAVEAASSNGAGQSVSLQVP